jgi:DNA-binding NtrC family response regulator
MSTRSALIVDDEKNIRLTLAHALEAIQVEAAPAINGEEALAMLGERSFDLVLLDLRLPGMSGMEVLRHLHRDYPQLPVVVITAYGTVDSAVEAMRCGAVNFLQKPFAPEEIREVVSAVLERTTSWDKTGTVSLGDNEESQKQEK